MRRIVVRTLSRELRLHTDSDEAFAGLSYVGADPIMPDATLAPVDLKVEPSGSFFRIEPPGRPAIDDPVSGFTRRSLRASAANNVHADGATGRRRTQAAEALCRRRTVAPAGWRPRPSASALAYRSGIR